MGDVKRALVLLAAALPAFADNRPPERPARPLTDRVFETTTERIERGEYLVNGILQCFVCHSERDWTKPGAPPVEGRAGAGRVWRDDGEYRLVAPNLTSDEETGIGRWSDDMLARAIREGVGYDGRALSPAMFYRSFSRLADEDLASVIVYLRSLEPIANPLPRTFLSDEETLHYAIMPTRIDAPVAAPDPADAVAYGKYLIGLADCSGCHTAWSAPRMPGEFGGGNLISRYERRSFSTNLTRHQSGVFYPAETFAVVMRTGKGGTLHGLMPWDAFSRLTDSDLHAVYAALRTTFPVAHYISNTGTPTACPVCGLEHPAGDVNAIESVSAADIDTSVYHDYSGSYFNSEFGLTISVRTDGDRLLMREDQRPEVELIPITEKLFAVPGGLAPVEFVTATDGSALSLISKELNPLELRRIADASVQGSPE